MISIYMHFINSHLLYQGILPLPRESLFWKKGKVSPALLCQRLGFFVRSSTANTWIWDAPTYTIAVLSTYSPEAIHLLPRDRTSNIQMWQGMTTHVSRLEIRESELHGSSFPTPHSAMHEAWYFSDPFIIWFSSLKQWKTNPEKELIDFHLFSELNQPIKGLEKCQRAKERKAMKPEARREMGKQDCLFG